MTETLPDYLPPVNLAPLHETLNTLLAPWVRELGLQLVAATPGEVTLALPLADKHIHAGGVLCGQTMLAAADTAMLLAIISQLGSFRPMTTVQLQTSFLRPVAAGSGPAKVVGRVLRMGKNLVYGEVELFSATGQLAAHATSTYALI